MLKCLTTSPSSYNCREFCWSKIIAILFSKQITVNVALHAGVYLFACEQLLFVSFVCVHVFNSLVYTFDICSYVAIFYTW